MDFNQAWPLLEKASVRGDGITKEDVKSGLETGRFLIFTGERSAALCVWEDTGTLRIALAGGDLDELIEIHGQIRAFAKKNGFKRLEIIGRGGWARKLPGYRKVAVLLRCEL